MSKYVPTLSHSSTRSGRQCRLTKSKRVTSGSTNCSWMSPWLQHGHLRAVPMFVYAPGDVLFDEEEARQQRKGIKLAEDLADIADHQHCVSQHGRQKMRSYSTASKAASGACPAALTLQTFANGCSARALLDVPPCMLACLANGERGVSTCPVRRQLNHHVSTACDNRQCHRADCGLRQSDTDPDKTDSSRGPRRRRTTQLISTADHNPKVVHIRLGHRMSHN